MAKFWLKKVSCGRGDLETEFQLNLFRVPSSDEAKTKKYNQDFYIIIFHVIFWTLSTDKNIYVV